MKKRILSLALCVLMVLTLLPAVALADGTAINEVGIYVDAPRLGAKVDTASYTPTSGFTVTEEYWCCDTDGDDEIDIERCAKFEYADGDYMFCAVLQADSSSYFPAQSNLYTGTIRMNGSTTYGGSALVSDDGKTMIIAISVGRPQDWHSNTGYSVVWHEDFEDACDWTEIDNDGDGYTWEYSTVAACCGNRGVSSYSYINAVGARTPDNWLVSPSVKIGRNYVFSFSAKAIDPLYPNEKLGVYIAVGDGEFVQFGSDVTVHEDWTIYSADLSAYSGKTVKIAIVHHNVTDQYGVVVDCAYMLQKASAAYPFSDVQVYGKHQPYADAILWAANTGITTGYSGGYFKPDQDCTRAQVVTFLWRAAGSPEPTSSRNPFKDVKSGGAMAPYYKAILWAVEKGITSGYPDGTFRPNEVCTRAQFVTFLWRYEGKTTVNISNPFRDVGQSPYYQAILWAYSTGVTTGYGNGYFKPDKVCSRAEVVTFIYRAET